MSSLLWFKGRVVVITGAGRGLGRQYALLFGERGASVVVNDLGGGRQGDGQSQSAADEVVSEINSKGGKAIANYDSVENGEKIIETAVKNFGRVDIIINNAGILRDRSFANIKDEDWDIINRIHLYGSYKVTRAAWNYLKQQKFGRIIMTASGAGIFGNFGQSNYSAAKMGLIGLSNTLAIEGAKYGIHSNVIVPVAASRLTQDVLPPDIYEQLKPEYVAPVVAWLCHDTCPENGGVFQAAGGWVGKYQWQHSQGAAFSNVNNLTIESVRDNWDKITDMTDGPTPTSVQEDLGLVSQAIEEAKESASVAEYSGDGFNVDVAKRFKMPITKYSYTAKDAILYALGVGINSQDNNYLKYLYEGSDEFCVLPTFGVIPAQMAFMKGPIISGGVPGLPIDISKVLHGEQYLELLRPLEPCDNLECKSTLVDVLDKKSGAVLVLDVDAYNEAGDHVMYAQFTAFVTGAGGFGGPRNSDKVIPPKDPPSRPPDAVRETKTTSDMPAVYRLSGDINPLHIDPSFAALAGFSKPILHGLCSFGIASRHILLQYANDDVTKFKSIKVRFSKPVFPGQTLQTLMWKEGSCIIFQSKVVETGAVVLSGGYVELKDIVVEEKPQILHQNLMAEGIFNTVAERLSTKPELAKKAKGCFQWDITKSGSFAQSWTVDLKSTPNAIYKGIPKNNQKADVTVTLADEDLEGLVTGKINAQKAFFDGRIKAKGNVMLLQNIQKLIQNEGAKL